MVRLARPRQSLAKPCVYTVFKRLSIFRSVCSSERLSAKLQVRWSQGRLASGRTSGLRPKQRFFMHSPMAKNPTRGSSGRPLHRKKRRRFVQSKMGCHRFMAGNRFVHPRMNRNGQWRVFALQPGILNGSSTGSSLPATRLEQAQNRIVDHAMVHQQDTIEVPCSSRS